MNTIQLTKKLISIPSWVDKKTNEEKIGEFIYQYLQQFSWLTVQKQKVLGKRFNIIAKDRYPTELLLIGHMDTVQPKINWKTNPVKPVIKNSRLYGLGATDMKSGLASILNAITQSPTQGVMTLFYIDEEYDFLGSKKFLKEFS